jgi:hypothetical protein
VRVGAAHQRAVGIGEVGLACRRRIVLGRLGLAAAPALLRLIGGALGLILRPGGLGLGAGLLLQPGAGGVELGLQRLAPDDLGRQRLRVGLAFGIRRLGLGGQFGDVGGEPGAELLRPVVA